MKLSFLCAILTFSRGYSLKPPSIDYCEDNGGKFDLQYSNTGMWGLCLFDDGTACGDWKFVRGECEKGSTLIFSTFCDETGGQLTSKNVDWAGEKFNVCVFDDGTECDE
eukprot:CAMPEP_0183737264 /NCGR_PEP_ID=MMETSP0737-20130205/51458_1 /TAXON_ID=385413 /ORGANISM="Thalassiosira miniscula, Strain CCMP1093" /LENGTH=108 /DNA_ID=CAMNT_0025971499 /DNA_START=853 /DNA_END=1176 /DNA_ORIENTATION=+